MCCRRHHDALPLVNTLLEEPNGAFKAGVIAWLRNPIFGQFAA